MPNDCAKMLFLLCLNFLSSSLYFCMVRQLARIIVTFIPKFRLRGTLVLLCNYYGELGTVERFIYLDHFVLEIK